MTLWFRLLQTFESSLLASRLAPLDECRLRLRTWPTDYDLSGHVSDNRYLELMKLSRYALASRLGILGEMAKRNVSAHVGAAEVQYLQGPALFAPIDLVGRVVAWDDQWLYVEHRIEAQGAVSAIGRIELAFRHGDQPVSASLVMSWSGTIVASPAVPEEFRNLRAHRPCRAARCLFRFTEDDLPGLGSASAAPPPL